jgi:hypothetical protein
MEFLTAFLVEVSRVFSGSCFYLHLSVLQKLFINRLEFSYFSEFLVGTVFLKPEYSMVFFKNRLVEGTLKLAWSKRLLSFVKLLSKNSISGFY